MARVTDDDGWIDPPAGAKPVVAADDGWIDPPTAAPEPTVTVLSAANQGAKQGVSFGFHDEIVGLDRALSGSVKDLLGGRMPNPAKLYREARDAERAANHLAEGQQGGAYLAGNVVGGVAGSVLPGVGALGTVAKGAGVAKAAIGAAKIGAAQAVGETESEDLGENLSNAASGGLLGAATGGLMHKLVAGAPERAVKRTLGDLTEGAPSRLRDRLVGKATAKADGIGERVKDVLPIMAEKPFKKAGRDAGKLLSAAEDALEAQGAHLDDLYAKAGKTGGIAVNDIMRTMLKIGNDLEKNPGTAPLARAVYSKVDDTMAAWGNRTHVAAKDVREFATAIGKNAFSGAPSVAPAEGKAVAQEVWGGLKDLIFKNMNEIGASTELRAANKRYSTLKNIQDAVTYRATRESTQSTRARDVISGGVNMALAATDLGALAGKLALQHVALPLGKKADDVLARIVTAAQNGSTLAQLTTQAIQMGASPVVAGTLAQWAAKQARSLTGEDARTQ